MIQFDEEIYFYLLGVIPVVVVLFVLLQVWKNRTQRKFADLPLLKRITPNRSRYKSSLKLLLFLCFH